MLNLQIDGVRSLLTSGVSTLFAIVNKVVLLILTSFLNLLTTDLAADYPIELDVLTSALSGLHDPTFLNVGIAVLNACNVQESIVFKLGPLPFLFTQIDVQLLLKQAAPLANHGQILFKDLIQVLISNLSNTYSLKLPNYPKIQ